MKKLTTSCTSTPNWVVFCTPDGALDAICTDEISVTIDWIVENLDAEIVGCPAFKTKDEAIRYVEEVLI